MTTLVKINIWVLVIQLDSFMRTNIYIFLVRDRDFLKGASPIIFNIQLTICSRALLLVFALIVAYRSAMTHQGFTRAMWHDYGARANKTLAPTQQPLSFFPPPSAVSSGHGGPPLWPGLTASAVVTPLNYHVAVSTALPTYLPPLKYLIF